ncbi:MAG: Calx-beta domain-containing protein [Chthoniobacterales bacterium]
MKTTFARCLITLLGAVVLQPAAQASFHEMQIEQLIGSVGGDTTAQAIQLRMRAPGQNFVSQGKLVVFDAAGQNPITVLDLTSNVTNGATGDRVLIASPNFPSHTSPPAMPDFTMANLIPSSYFAAGSLVWQADSTGEILWSLSWGGAAYTGPTTGSTTNDADGEFGPAFPGLLSATCTSALLFPGTATALSTNNAADYLATTGNIVFTNNAHVSFTITVTLPTVTINATDPNASENPLDNGKCRIIRSGGCIDNALTVFYSVSGTATNETDYQRLRGRTSIKATRPSGNLPVKPIDDTIAEPDETVIVTLSPDSGYTIGSPSSATVTIHSNE